MPDPPAWPTRPASARDFDLFWLVPSLPPDPFPDESYDYGSDERFGPPGTRWVFSLESLWNRQTAPGVSQISKAAIERLFRKLALKLPPAGSTSWATPYPIAPPATAVEMELGNMQRWIRTSINGLIGTDEQVVHVLNWRHKTIENAEVDNATLQTLANSVRDHFTAFLGQKIGGNGFPYIRDMPSTLTYTDVRASVLTQDAPGAKPVWGPQTQYALFASQTGQGTSGLMPYEVALGLSLNTNFRGTSRFRGRLYLGPLTTVVMGPAGQFNPAYVNIVGTNFGTNVLGGVQADTSYEPHIISQKYGTSAKVTGIRVGQTPDSQRRRRRSRPEQYAQVWGTAVGAA